MFIIYEFFFFGFSVWLPRKFEKMQEQKRKNEKDMEFVLMVNVVGNGFGNFLLPAVWLPRKLRGKERKAKEIYYECCGCVFGVSLAKFCCFMLCGVKYQIFLSNICNFYFWLNPASIFVM